MKTSKTTLVTTFVLAAFAAGALFTAPALAGDGPTPFEAAILGGVQGLMSNDTALPDDFVNIPLAASLAYHATSIFAVEGEFAWLIPVQNSVSVTSNQSEDLKTPNVLSYQANLRAQIPVGSPSLSPYVTAGAGAMTFLSTTDADRYPQLAETQTTFAINFGLGTGVPLTESLSLRGDFREFVAFPQDDQTGLSNGTTADPIWMPRGTFGLAYRF
jgi:Outer membrane protein beta-barrel domain